MLSHQSIRSSLGDFLQLSHRPRYLKGYIQQKVFIQVRFLPQKVNFLPPNSGIGVPFKHDSASSGNEQPRSPEVSQDLALALHPLPALRLTLVHAQMVCTRHTQPGDEANLWVYFMQANIKQGSYGTPVHKVSAFYHSSTSYTKNVYWQQHSTVPSLNQVQQGSEHHSAPRVRNLFSDNWLSSKHDKQCHSAQENSRCHLSSYSFKLPDLTYGNVDEDTSPMRSATLWISSHQHNIYIHYSREVSCFTVTLESQSTLSNIL